MYQLERLDVITAEVRERLSNLPFSDPESAAAIAHVIRAGIESGEYTANVHGPLLKSWTDFITPRQFWKLANVWSKYRPWAPIEILS